MDNSIFVSSSLSPLSISLKKNFFLRFDQVRGQDYNTSDGTCIRDYIHVTDLVDAHVKAMGKAQRGEVSIYNVGTGKGATRPTHSLFPGLFSVCASIILPPD